MSNTPFTTDQISGRKKTSAAIVSGYDPLDPSKPLARKGGRALYLPPGYGNYLSTYIPKSRTLYVGIAIRVKQVCTFDVLFSSRVPCYKVCRNSPSHWYPVLSQPDTTTPGSQIPTYYGSLGMSYGGSLRTVNLSGNTQPQGEVYDVFPGQSTSGLMQDYLGVASCRVVINQTNISCRWDFGDPSIPVKVGSVNHNSNPFNGDYFYYQLGISLLGNNPVDGYSSWVENRIGSRADKSWSSRCQTTLDNDPNRFYINNVFFAFSPGSSGICIDDVYIANDEGDVNNNFLGSVYVRNASVLSQGSSNDAVPVNTSTGNRGDSVSGEFVSTSTEFETKTNTSPAGLSVATTDINTSHFVIKKEGDLQSVVFNPVIYNGAAPRIYAVVLHIAALASCSDQLAPTLLASIIPGIDSPVYANLNYRPVFFHQQNRGYVYHIPEVLSYVLENRDEYPSSVFNSTVLNNCEFGLSIAPHHRDASDWASLPIRKSVFFNEVVRSSLDFACYCSRYIEESLYSAISLSDVSSRDWGASSLDDLIFFDSSEQALAYNMSVFELLHPEDSYPGAFPQVSSVAILGDYSTSAFVCFVSDSLSFIDTSYGVNVEELTSSVVAVSADSCDVSVSCDDSFSVIESDLFDGHLDVDEILSADSSYVWNGHEQCDEYLHQESSIVFAWVQLVDSLVDFEHDDFGGFWVENSTHSANLSDSVLTQHWRYEWFMGVCINSWQITPVEDPGMDGYRVGDTHF